ncbi:MAG: phosphodiesterase [Gammaproteobacteria bacterium]
MTLPARAGAIAVLQITDTHLYASPDRAYTGIDTLASFEAVLALARRTHWPTDAIIMTGDLSNDGSEAAYCRLRTRLTALDVPVYCVSGNHDDEETMRRVLPGRNVHVVPGADMGAWRAVFVDTVQSGQVGGRVGAAALETLERELAGHRAQPALICMHHPPVALGSRWLDRLGVANGEALLEVLDRYANARAVIWGHAHQAFDDRRGALRLLGAPSTCVQFAPGAEDYRRDTLKPGYRWLRLHADGRLESGVQRLG